MCEAIENGDSPEAVLTRPLLCHLPSLQSSPDSPKVEEQQDRPRDRPRSFFPDSVSWVLSLITTWNRGLCPDPHRL